MSANDWFRERMGNNWVEQPKNNSNDVWNVVKIKQHKKQLKPMGCTYIPPGKRIESTESSWELKQKLEKETKIANKNLDVPTPEDFPSLGTEKIVLRDQSKWGVRNTSLKKEETKNLPPGWYNITSGNYPKGPLIHTNKYGLPFFQTGFPDDPEAEWLQKYSEMYPDNKDYPEHDLSSEKEESKELCDDYQDNNIKEVKYSGRRARKNHHCEDNDFY
jgi:hypothetical protein